MYRNLSLSIFTYISTMVNKCWSIPPKATLIFSYNTNQRTLKFIEIWAPLEKERERDREEKEREKEDRKRRREKEK